MSDVGDVPTGKQVVDDPTFLRLQEVHYVLDWWTVSYTTTHSLAVCSVSMDLTSVFSLEFPVNLVTAQFGVFTVILLFLSLCV